ncbi:MAG: hypothetical protein E7675_04910 [Ruminococcaceae bacterium]|nr:hypothetical protein [Oscillospiraceae bacterium]
MKDHRNTAGFEQKHSPVIPMVFLMESSDELMGEPIDNANEFLKNLKSIVENNPMLSKQADISVVSFNSHVKTKTAFSSAKGYVPPRLVAKGGASFNKAVLECLDIINKRTAEYKKRGISYFKPYLFCFTNGRPTDNELEELCKNRLYNELLMNNLSVIFTSMGDGADIQCIKSYFYPADPFKYVGTQSVTENMLKVMDLYLKVKQEESCMRP